MDKYNVKWVLLFKQGKTKQWAVTLGQTTYYSVSENDISTTWKKHEDKHKEQWKRDGFKFPFKYIWYTIKYGYKNNPYEIEARQAEIT